jgi:cytochrome P450
MMQSAADLPLPVLAMEDSTFGDDPFSKFSAARAQHPWLAKCSFGYVITQYTAMRELLGQDEAMRTPGVAVVEVMKAQGSKWGKFQLETINAASKERHKRLREVVAPMFTPRAANEHRALMRRVITQLLDEWAPQGAFDFEEFASYFPITVMCSLIGAPTSVLPKLRSSLETLGLSFSLIPSLLPKLEQATDAVERFVTQLIADRRSGQRLSADPDLLDVLLKACDSDFLTREEIENLLTFMFVAGYDTSKNVLTMIMDEMIKHPEIYERCAADAAFCRKVVDEAFRYQNPSTIPRLLNHDLVYRDVVFPKDSMLFFPVSISGRDPAVFHDADSFDPDRRQEDRHLGFGRGAHMCLGQFIARAQIEEGLHLIARRITKPHLTGRPGHRPFPGVWGLRGLPIKFTPASAHTETTS